MNFDTFLIICCAVGAVITYVGYRYFSENVWLKWKEQGVRE